MQLKAAKVKDCEKITEWSEPIRNHFWFVCHNCTGDLENLKVILRSLGYTQTSQLNKCLLFSKYIFYPTDKNKHLV